MSKADKDAGSEDKRRAVKMLPQGTPPPCLLDHTAVMVGDQDRRSLLVFGGYNPLKRENLNSLYEYDMEQKSWSLVDVTRQPPVPPAVEGAVPPPLKMPKIPRVRSEQAMCVLSAKADAEGESRSYFTLMFGGGNLEDRLYGETWLLVEQRPVDGSPAPEIRWRWQCVLTEADSADDPDVPSPRLGHSIVAVSEDRALLFGGFDGCRRLDDMYEFTLSNRQWKKLSCTGLRPSPRDGHAAAFVNGKMYIFGGYSFCRTNDLFVFDPQSSEWCRLPLDEQTPTPRMGHSLVAHPGNGRLYLFNGYDGQILAPDVVEYDPATGRWSPLNFPLVTSTGVEAPLEGRKAMACAFAAQEQMVMVVGGMVEFPQRPDTSPQSPPQPGKPEKGEKGGGDKESAAALEALIATHKGWVPSGHLWQYEFVPGSDGNDKGKKAKK